MGRPDDRSRRARLDAAADLCGVDLILECERAASRRNPRHRDPKRWSERVAPLPLHGSPRAEPRRPRANLRTIALRPQKPAAHEWTAGFFIAEATGTALSAHLVRWNVIRLAEQPPFCAGVEIGLNSIAVPLQSAPPFRS